MTSVHVCTAKTTRDIKGCVSNLDSFWLRAVWIHPLVTVISKKRFLHCFWHVSVEEDIPLGKQSQCNRSHSQSSHLYMKELTSFQEHPGPQVLCGSCYCSVLFWGRIPQGTRGCCVPSSCESSTCLSRGGPKWKGTPFLQTLAGPMLAFPHLEVGSFQLQWGKKNDKCSCACFQTCSSSVSWAKLTSGCFQGIRKAEVFNCRQSSQILCSPFSWREAFLGALWTHTVVQLQVNNGPGKQRKLSMQCSLQEKANSFNIYKDWPDNLLLRF